MTTSNIKGALEALLFVSDEPVSGVRLAKVLDVSAGEIDSELANLAQEYREQNRGFQLREVAGGWRLFTHPAFHELIESYVLSWDTRRLSQAALEALAVIAYHQPVTRAGINAIRGVNSEGVVSSLIEKGLVRETGRDRNQGNAILYGTTRTFLEKFGMKDIGGLPPLEDFAPDDSTKSVIKKRLGVESDTATGDEEIDENIADSYGQKDDSDTMDDIIEVD
ncbi:MAG: SMC-Scp complex subunit ScpB [Coriobacteriia bacterium]|nr:SMC-Scp complex subunit ScpB [Coriobacteriia bacterium]